MKNKYKIFTILIAAFFLPAAAAYWQTEKAENESTSITGRIILPSCSFGVISTVPHKNKLKDELNYYAELALWVGGKSESGTFVVCGQGNEKSSVPEWRPDSFSEEDGSYITVYDDKRTFDGNVPAGITVRQGMQPEKNGKYTVLTYAVTNTSATVMEGVYIGLSSHIVPPDAEDKAGFGSESVSVSGGLFPYAASKKNAQAFAGVVPYEAGYGFAAWNREKGPETDGDRYRMLAKAKQSYSFGESDNVFLLSKPVGNLKPGETAEFSVLFIESDNVAGLANKLKLANVPLLSAKTAAPVETLTETPGDYRLFQNYPNPFNPQTEIRFSIPAGGTVKVQIFSLTGQRIKTLLNRAMPAGTFKVEWDGTNDTGGHVSSGMYFYRLETEQFTDMKRMVLLK